MAFESTSNKQYSGFIALSRYARWLPEESRRETWSETVGRYVQYFDERVGGLGKYAEEIYNAIYNLDVMPSMRALMTAGDALDRDNVAGFNCSYLAINRQRAFDELMYILMCGTGVGFSCERQEIQQLPTVAEEFYESETTIVVPDSKIGWASSFRELISLLYAGKVPKWDLSKVRPAGASLKTFGGRASGPEPLDDLFRYSVNIFRNAAGRKLTSLEVHGMVCKIAEIVVVGGVRRSALISLSNLSDDRMRHAKSGQWWVDSPEFALANNSACYTEKPDIETFMREWLSLVESKSGERGIFNREASQKQALRNGRRDGEYSFGTNPCSEIILRDRQFCNLSEVVVRHGDSFDDLKQKVRIATILGSLQATLTDFRYLSKAWKINTEEEALLGVSLTGIMDHPVLSGQEAMKDNGEGSGEFMKQELKDWLDELKNVAIETNLEWSEKLGIKQSTAITCVKPSGTVSQLVDSASGIHPRYSPYYIRTVRADKKDPLAKFMKDRGFPVEDDVMKPDSTYVFSFPMKAPEDAVFRDDRNAIEQLEHWLTYQRHWCEHKPSVTIYVKDNEWMDVGAWVYRHFDEMSGVSFLPHSDHTYRQAPYQEITEAEYYDWVKRMPVDINWKDLGLYEFEDRTTSSQTMACSGGICEVVDLA
ncbi:MAG: ribonucleoside-triphosphate reductase [Chromatiaceae bacterium]|nr:ribonucleoside-triphosphate reductase [Chromatiaceae bacterium]